MESKRPTTETLYDLYWNQRLTTRQIAEQFGVSHMSIKRWLRKSDIPRRAASRGLDNRGLRKPSRDELNELVHIQHLPYAEVASRFGVHERMIHHWLDGYDLPRSSVWTTRRRGKNPVLPTSDELRRLYLDEGLSTDAIGQRFGVSSEPIVRLMRLNGIDMREPGFNEPHRVICTDGHAVRSSVERIVDDWLSSHDIPHEYEPRLSFDRRFMADFLARDTYIEVWGVEGHEKYSARKQKKIALYVQHGLSVVHLHHDSFHGAVPNWETILENTFMR
jgi:transposase